MTTCSEVINRQPPVCLTCFLASREMHELKDGVCPCCNSFWFKVVKVAGFKDGGEWAAQHKEARK